MTSAFPKSSSGHAKLSPATSEAGESDAKDKRARILGAAQQLFLRYGVKRTSIDDVALAAQIAKGTVYLYYKSKNELFAAVAELLCADILATARQTLLEKKPLNERLVDCLDSYIGQMHRLTMQSPHVAELSESKEALAATIYARFEVQMRGLIRSALDEAGIVSKGAADMLFAAAIGALKTGDAAKKPYRARLTALVDILILGLQVDRKIARERDA
jgi:AcrR family transcriptional regulator